MPEETEKRYLLAIKRNNNDYLPLEWNLVPFYSGENLTSIEGIDNFTRKLTRTEFIREAINCNILDIRERFEGFAIIYFEKGKYRELKEGTIFKEDSHIFQDEDFIQYIISNSDNKEVINSIYNLCSQKNTCSKLEEFKFILRKLDLFKNRGKNALYAAVSMFKSIPYSYKRKILIKTSNKLINISPLEEPSKLIYKNIYEDTTGKVA